MDPQLVRIRIKEIPKPTQVDTTDPHEIVDLLLTGTPLCHVPMKYHSLLLAPMTAKKNELLVAGKIDEARKINDLILDLSLTSYRRPRDSIKNNTTERCMSQSSRLPTIRALSAKDPSVETQEIEFHTNVLSSEKYWKSEIQYYNERRQQAFADMERRHQEEMDELQMSGTSRRFRSRVTSASQTLRQKEAKAKNQEQVAKLKERAEFIEAFDVEQRSTRAAATLSQQRRELQEKHDFEKVTLERQWKIKWDNLQLDMKNDLRQKKINFGQSGLRKSLPTRYFMRTRI